MVTALHSTLAWLYCLHTKQTKRSSIFFLLFVLFWTGPLGDQLLQVSIIAEMQLVSFFLVNKTICKHCAYVMVVSRDKVIVVNQLCCLCWGGDVSRKKKALTWRVSALSLLCQLWNYLTDCGWMSFVGGGALMMYILYIWLISYYTFTWNNYEYVPFQLY